MKDLQSEVRHARLVVDRILESHIDITDNYDDWMRIAFALASLGEPGEDLFLKVSSMSRKYNHDDCTTKYNNIKEKTYGRCSIGTFFEIAKRYGVDISMPKGRPQKNDEQRKGEQVNKINAAIAYLADNNYRFRFNAWIERTEMYKDGKWAPMTERDFANTFITLKSNGISISDKDLQNLLKSEQIAKEYDAVQNYLESLPAWQPAEGDDIENERFADDPIREVIEHIEFVDDENHEFYIHFIRKWFVGLVGMMSGKISEHNIMMVLCGKQHRGKTHIIRHILPPELHDYYKEVTPTAHVDKDFIISLSEFVLIFLDEFSFKDNAMSQVYKQLVSSNSSNERRPYDHFHERRIRRAALVGATNDTDYLIDRKGDRRYLSVEVESTKNLDKHPFDYDRAYAMALYLLEHGYQCKPTAEESEQISKHNERFMAVSDCEGLLESHYRKPTLYEKGTAMTAAEIMNQLHIITGRCKNFSSQEIGRCLTQLGFEKRILHGKAKYLVIERSEAEIKEEQERDAEIIMKEQMAAREELPEYEEDNLF